MSMKYIRKTYGVPAKRGMMIRFMGFDAVITGSTRSGAYLRIRYMDAPLRPPGKTFPIHPTWGVEYPTT